MQKGAKEFRKESYKMVDKEETEMQSFPEMSRVEQEINRHVCDCNEQLFSRSITLSFLGMSKWTE
jgi:hypothetical protein